MKCPLCGVVTVEKFRPFCSKRCADVDLSRWLNGSYAVPSEHQEEIHEALEEVSQETRHRH